MMRFTFIGPTAHRHEGELRFQIDAATSQTYVEGDVNCDGVADFL